MTNPHPVTFGDVPVDSGRILVVDPCHLDPELVARLTTPTPGLPPVAIVVGTPMGDGPYELVDFGDGQLSILDPYSELNDKGDVLASAWRHDSTRLIAAV